MPRSQGLIWQTPWFSEKKKVLESPPTIHSNEKITTFPWKSHSNTGCWWMFHYYITLLQLVWYQQGAKIKVFSNSIQYDPIHLMAVNCILYMLHSLILCKGMLAIDPWEPDLSEGPALAKMSHENYIFVWMLIVGKHQLDMSLTSKENLVITDWCCLHVGCMKCPVKKPSVSHWKLAS